MHAFHPTTASFFSWDDKSLNQWGRNHATRRLSWFSLNPCLYVASCAVTKVTHQKFVRVRVFLGASLTFFNGIPLVPENESKRRGASFARVRFKHKDRNQAKSLKPFSKHRGHAYGGNKGGKVE